MLPPFPGYLIYVCANYLNRYWLWRKHSRCGLDVDIDVVHRSRASIISFIVISHLQYMYSIYDAMLDIVHDNYSILKIVQTLGKDFLLH